MALIRWLCSHDPIVYILTALWLITCGAVAALFWHFLALAFNSATFS